MGSRARRWRRFSRLRAVRAGKWALTVAVVMAAAVCVFNSIMRVRARREAERIAADTPFGRAFEGLDYEGDGDFGVLFFHGIHGTPEDFKLITAGLRERRIHHYAAMLGGDRPSPATGLGFTDETLARHAADAYEHLASRCSHIVVVGFSLGGVQATDLASRHPVAGLVLVAPGYRIAGRWYLPPSVEAWSRALAPIIPLVPKAGPAYINDPAAEKEYRGLSTAALPAAVALADYAPKVLARSRRVTAPVLCILSRADDVIDLSTAQTTVKSFPCESRRFLWCNRAYHTILSDYGRQDAAREIIQFIQSCRDGSLRPRDSHQAPTSSPRRRGP